MKPLIYSARRAHHTQAIVQRSTVGAEYDTDKKVAKGATLSLLGLGLVGLGILLAFDD